ncbi:FimB/Mfa2 family fimbrial subunit [uncultured Parabacteroides sp.]|uniref:FimB/Mfa2 family fimbrial subunit n=1 Tax=uncultured Parabacteroides sp. TaxID=512312 RepID=UPI00258D2B24|nr:FimB/Mfa2 family fimbrial subunit [uncultured Parabacteroides sp.]
MKQYNSYHRLLVAFLFIWICGLSACDYIHDELPPCKHYLSFVYDYNMKYADAFTHEVDRVNLYIFDKEGKLLDERLIEGEELKANRIELGLEPGTYQLMAWGGLNETDYAWEQLTIGTSTPADFQMAVKYDNHTVSRELTGLFQGRLTLEIPDGGETHTLFPVMKDTNKLRFVLQDTANGTALDADDFTFTVVTRNSDLDADNRPLSNEPLTWLPYYQETVQVIGSDGQPSVSAVCAELNTLRLMDGSETSLLIGDKASGRILLDVDLTDFLLLTKMEAHNIPAQEYLDRQDEYAVVIFLSRTGNGYHCLEVIVNDWTIRLDDLGLGNEEL